MLQTKGLWVEDLDGNDARVIQHIADTGANLVCVRTTSSELLGLIPKFQQMNVKVYGWRWPHVYPKPGLKDDPALWTQEIKRVVYDLIPAGLDGYIFDIESDEGKLPQDWDNPDYKALLPVMAKSMADTIKGAFDRRLKPYLLGLTSHARGFSNYPGIPWKPFLDVCSVLYPQTYWRFRDGNNVCTNENPDPVTHQGAGTPAQALKNGFDDYGPKGKPIIPVAGEISCAKAGEMAAFGQLVAQRGLTEAHFYVDVDNGTLAAPGVLAEIKAL